MSRFSLVCYGESKFIRDRLNIAQSTQKSYASVRRRELEFQVHDCFFLKVLHIKGVMRFGKTVKLIPMYVGLYKILKRISKVAYELELSSRLSSSAFGLSHLALEEVYG